MSQESKNRKIGAVLQLVQLILSVIITLVYTSFMIKKIGQAEYGVYSVCSSTVGYLSLLSLGMNSSYIRFFTRSKTKKDSIDDKELNWQYFCLFSIFGIIAFVLGMILATRADLFFNEDYSDELINKAKILMGVLAVNMAISFPASIFSSHISSQQRFIFLKLINVIKSIISPIAQYILLILGYGSIGMVIALTLVNAIADFINVFYCIKVLRMKFTRCKFNFGFLKRIASFSFYIGIAQIVYQLNFSADKLVLSKISSVEQVAIYSVAATLNTHVEQIGSALANLFDPKVNNIISNDKDERTKKRKIDFLFVKVGRIQFYLLMLIVTGFIFYGKFFVDWWAGEEYQSAYYVTLLLVIPLTIPLVQNMAVYIQRAKNKHRFRSILYLITSIINVFISLFFAKLFGAMGAALGTTITLLVNSTANNIYYKNVVGLDIKKFWWNILYVSRGLVLPILFGTINNYFFPPTRFWQFILYTIVYSSVYFVSFYVLSFNDEEKQIIKSVYKRKNN